MDYRVRYIPDLDSRFIDNTIEPTLEERTRRADWFDRLEVSLRRDGCRNPVILTAHQGADELHLTPRYGGSRLWVAQRIGLLVPAVIADFDDCFPEACEMTSIMEIWEKFPNPPRKIILKPYGINVSGCPDVHMHS